MEIAVCSFYDCFSRFLDYSLFSLRHSLFFMQYFSIHHFFSFSFFYFQGSFTELWIKYHMYPDGCLSFPSSVYLPAWMAKAVACKHSKLLPLLTLDLFLALQCTSLLQLLGVMESTVTFKSRLWQDHCGLYPSGIFSNILPMVSSHASYIAHEVWCYPMCSVRLTLDQLFQNRFM